MRRIYITIICSFFVWLTACKKSDAPVAPLPDGSVSIVTIASKDTLEMPISVLSDSAVTIQLQAMLSGEKANADHWVKFKVDTSKMKDYRAKYGNQSLLMPSTAYYFYKPLVRLAAGSSLSDLAELNIGQQTKLEGYATYVLPVVVQSVDDNTDLAAKEKVLYVVFKTGKPAFYTKDGWAIEDHSSHNATLVPANLIDNNETTSYWLSNIAQTMPQWVTINFNKTITFSAVNYYFPTAVPYPSAGGYPTSIRIETSMDGTTWVDNGTFAGNIVSNMQTLNVGDVTAKYLRFTVLAVVKYASYDCVFISGIKLVP